MLHFYLLCSIRISGAVFSGQLRHQLRVLVPNLPPETEALILESIKATLSLPEEIRGPAITAYINAVDRVFIVGIVVASVSGLCALLIQKNKIVRNKANIS